MEAFREIFEDAVQPGIVTELQAVCDDECATRFEDTRCFAHHLPTRFFRQLVEQVDADNDVHGRVFQWQDLRLPLQDIDMRPRRHHLTGALSIIRGKIQPACVETRESAHRLSQETARTAGKIQQCRLTLVPAFQLTRDIGQRGTAHRISRAGEQRLDLMVIEFRTLIGQPTIGLVVEVLSIVGRIPVGAIERLSHLDTISRHAAAIYLSHILEEVPGPADSLAEIGQPNILRCGIEACFNIGTIHREQTEIRFAQFACINIILRLEGRLTGTVETGRAALRNSILSAIPGGAQALGGGIFRTPDCLVRIVENSHAPNIGHKAPSVQWHGICCDQTGPNVFSLRSGSPVSLQADGKGHVRPPACERSFDP